MQTRVRSVEFTNFKGLSRYKLQLEAMNVLVGPNNCGKSTIISAFRALDVGLRTARSRTSEIVDGPNGSVLGYPLSIEMLPLSLENVHTDYSAAATTIRFVFSDDNYLDLFFPKDGGAYLIPYVTSKAVRSPKDFKRAFPVTLGVVPVLGPVDHREGLLEEQTVRRSVGTHRASRHFRNYWRLFPDGFDEFARLIAETWPSMTIQPPEVFVGPPPVLAMFSTEGGITRELFWSGFGFQIWCQLLTHISRARKSSLLIVDEPEVYLHPDLQRLLLSILRDAGPDVLLATHSSELIAEADVSEIIEVDKASFQAAMKPVYDKFIQDATKIEVKESDAFDPWEH